VVDALKWPGPAYVLCRRFANILWAAKSVAAVVIARNRGLAAVAGCGGAIP